MSRGVSEDLGFLISFINIVEKHPCLWNYKLKDYSKIDVTGLAWKTIAAELNDTVHNCRERWKNIRCAFVRSLKPRNIGMVAKSKKTYYLAKYLSFLVPFTKGKSTTGNFTVFSASEFISNYVDPEQNDTQTTDENGELYTLKDASIPGLDTADDQSNSDEPFQFIENSPPQKKKKLEPQHWKTSSNDADASFTEWANGKRQNQCKQEDEDTLFFQCLLPDFKKLDGRRKMNLKSKIISTLNAMLNDAAREATATPYSMTSNGSTRDLAANPIRIHCQEGSRNCDTTLDNTDEESKTRMPHSLSSAVGSIIQPHSRGTENEDEFDVVGRRIAFQLRGMDERQRLISEKLVSDIMFQGRLGKLKENSVVCISPSSHQSS